MTPKIRIDGEPVEPAPDASIVEIEAGLYSVLAGGASYEAWVEGSEITIGGRRFRFEIEDPREWRRSSGAAGGHGRASVTAPMPGRVVRVLVGVGDEVVTGQGIAVVEAMKMQNELKAPREGRVTAIGVKENDSVNAGTVLATIEQ